MQKKLPEVLSPVGSTEAFYAALEGGADAIYMGLRDFNARSRAKNFMPWQASILVNEAHKKGVKVYITLNIVVRNVEIQQLINTLNALDQIRPDAVIVQDWGVFYIIKKFFPKLVVHASTQMANHNSLGSEYSKQKGFDRVVMARELTLEEMTTIARKSKIELEIFVHGALCYSFSGMCTFSSYLGGASANRGLCAQPCRRIYKQNNNESYFFSLKDNQLIRFLPEMTKMGIASLKIEGRLKPAEYVHQSAKAYKMALTNPEKVDEAVNMLKYDMGREKTEYFVGGQVKGSITQAASTGLLLGRISKIENGKASFESEHEIQDGSRLRFRNMMSDAQVALKVPEFSRDENIYTFEYGNTAIQIGNEVYLAGLKIKVPSKIKGEGKKINERAPMKLAKQVMQDIEQKGEPNKEEYFIRVDTLDWLKKIRFEDVDGVFLKLTGKEFDQIKLQAPFLKKNKRKIILELPKFIQENKIEKYRKICKTFFDAGYQNFAISHLSQKLILPKGSRITTTENVYAFNDAAVAFLRSENISRYILPLENDIVNMGSCTDKWGIVPLYFYPELFYSRMPVDAKSSTEMIDKKDGAFRKIIREGITVVLPEIPVALTQYKRKLEKYGYKRFLIDLSYMKPSKTGHSILKRARSSAQIQPSANFNFKRELK